MTSFKGKKAKCFLVDPVYHKGRAGRRRDQVYCSSLAHAAVHGAMAGYTRFLVGNINTALSDAAFGSRGQQTEHRGDSRSHVDALAVLDGPAAV